MYPEERESWTSWTESGCYITSLGAYTSIKDVYPVYKQWTKDNKKYCLRKNLFRRNMRLIEGYSVTYKTMEGVNTLCYIDLALTNRNNLMTTQLFIDLTTEQLIELTDIAIASNETVKTATEKIIAVFLERKAFNPEPSKPILTDGQLSQVTELADYDPKLGAMLLKYFLM